MRKLQEIIDGLYKEDLKVVIPVDRILEFAIQIQRNEILEETLSIGVANDLAISIESLQKEIWELNRHLEKAAKSKD
jgi:hypothetical protein